MKLFIAFVLWLCHRGQATSDGRPAPANDGSDRSSMAEFVRILRMHDEDSSRPNYPN